MGGSTSSGFLASWLVRGLLVVVASAALVSYWLWPSILGPDTVKVRLVSPLTHSYKNTDPSVAYVGDAVCARCHAEIADAYHQHPMGRSMSTANAVLPHASGKVLAVNDLEYAIDRRDGRVFHRETRRDESGREVESREAEVKYALGSGTRGYSFLIERDGGLYQSPLSWYAQEQRWDLAPGYRTRNQHFERPIVLQCLFCHTNRVEMAPGRSPIFHGLAIGCERCHGPGELHARGPSVALRDGPDLTIVNPARLEPAALRAAVCEQCHLQGVERVVQPGRSPFDYRPGLPFEAFVSVRPIPPDPRFGRAAIAHVEQMRQSRCYQKSDGRLGCISCHDPHRLPAPDQRIDEYRDRCLECHADRGCSLPVAVRLAESPVDNCIACHMPQSRATDIPHTARTDHTIPRHGGAGTNRAKPGFFFKTGFLRPG